MARITTAHLGAAITKVGAMNLAEQEQLSDAIHRHQPNLLYSVVALKLSGATMDDIGVVLKLLMVCYQAMQQSGDTWPLISEATQEHNLARITKRLRKSERLSAAKQLAFIEKTILTHPEKTLLAYVVEEINNPDLPADDETAKRMMLVALNLVECIAQPTKPTPKHKR